MQSSDSDSILSTNAAIEYAANLQKLSMAFFISKTKCPDSAHMHRPHRQNWLILDQGFTLRFHHKFVSTLSYIKVS
jgi:hypothetical protein